jgi:hypothetical protein
MTITRITTTASMPTWPASLERLAGACRDRRGRGREVAGGEPEDERERTGQLIVEVEAEVRERGDDQRRDRLDRDFRDQSGGLELHGS